MNILYLSFLTWNKWAGPTYSVPKQIERLLIMIICSGSIFQFPRIMVGMSLRFIMMQENLENLILANSRSHLINQT